MKGNLLYEGKAKKIFEWSEANKVLVEYKDSLTAFNAQKKGEFQGKGKLNREMTSLLFQYLGKKGISHHWEKDLGTNEMVVHRLKIIPLEVVVRNVMAGSLAKRLGRLEGEALERPLVEFYLKNDELGDPFLSEEQVVVLGYEKQATLMSLKEQALKINNELKGLFAKANLNLIDFKLEFGRNHQEQIVLGDEISPDTCRLWDLTTKEKLDKDRFRRDLGGVDLAYQEVLKRLKEIL